MLDLVQAARAIVHACLAREFWCARGRCSGTVGSAELIRQLDDYCRSFGHPLPKR